MADELSLAPGDGVRVVWDRKDLAGLANGNGSGGRLDGRLDAAWDAVRIVSGGTSDGSLLALCAARPEGSDNHADDAVAAVLVDPEGNQHEIDEALLSTEYAADGRVRRFGLELYRPGEQYPLRAAGDAEKGEPGAADATRLSFRLDGSEGTALYEIVRRP